MFSCAGYTVGRCLELDATTTDGGVDKVATTMMTKTYFEDLGRIAESNAKSAQQSARIATEYWVSSRERNNAVAQEITRTITEGMKHQTGANEDLTSRILRSLRNATRHTSASSSSGPKRSAACRSNILARPRARRRRRPQA